MYVKSYDWCNEDDPDATTWGGENVYDIRTSSEGIALDGSKYADW